MSNMAGREISGYEREERAPSGRAAPFRGERRFTSFSVSSPASTTTMTSMISPKTHRRMPYEMARGSSLMSAAMPKAPSIQETTVVARLEDESDDKRAIMHGTVQASEATRCNIRNKCWEVKGVVGV